jgi:methyltransferase (TIGR00027 family)
MSRDPSRTGEIVALIRADIDRPVAPNGDPEAQRRLVAGMRPTGASRVRPQLLARTTFFDQAVLTAIAAGIRQVVICGAGYDDRALRFRTGGVRYFELDHPGTQRLKADALRGLDTSGLTLVAAEFGADDVAAALARAGQSAAEPSLFICEGLLVYLDQPIVVMLLSALAERAAPGSVLAASLATHPAGLDSRHVAEVANARRRAGQTEPWVTILPAPAHLDLLRRAGWEPAESIDGAELAPDLPPGRMLLVKAGLTPRR